MSKTKTLTEEERETSGGTLAVILLSVIIIWGTGGWLVNFTNTTDRGTFGDMFGAVNALFSGLAFATLIYTVFLQRRELQLQRLELAETRKELQRSASAQEASERALKAQADATAMSAKLNAINYLLGYYREEMARGEKVGMQLSDRREYSRLRSNEDHLVSMLEETYRSLTLPLNVEQRQSDSGHQSPPHP
jgi:hypothetical protein